jgi:hypothetical protein
MNTATSSRLEHAIGAEGLLAIRVRSGDVRINGIDGDVVRVRDTNDEPLEDMFAIEAAAGSLSLTAIGRGFEFILGSRSKRRRHNRHDPDLEIDIPRRATLVLEGVSSDIRAEGLVGDQRYRTTSGDVQLRAVSGHIGIEAVSGDVEIQATGTARIAARSESGDIELRAATVSTLKLTTTSGDMKVAARLDGSGPFTIETVSGDGLLAPAGDVRIEMTTMTGDLQSELDGDHGREHGRHSLVIGKSGPLVTFQSMSGDLRVVKPILVEHPVPPIRPVAPIAPVAPRAERARVATPIETQVNGAIAAAYDDARLRILRSLERGEIDVAEAGRRLEQLDAGDLPADAAAPAVDGVAHPSEPARGTDDPSGLDPRPSDG